MPKCELCHVSFKGRPHKLDDLNVCPECYEVAINKN